MFDITTNRSDLAVSGIQPNQLDCRGTNCPLHEISQTIFDGKIQSGCLRRSHPLGCVVSQEVVLYHEAIQGVPCPVLASEPSERLYAVLERVVRSFDDVVRHLPNPSPQSDFLDVSGLAAQHLPPECLRDAIAIRSTAP